MTENNSSDVALKRFELWIGLLKFIVGTVIMGLVSLFLNHQYQTNQLDLEREKSNHAIALQDKKAEFDYLVKFMTHAMNEDLEVRIRLASYMQSAALSENIKSIWKQYYDALVVQRTEKIEKRQELKEQVEELATKLKSSGQEDESERKKWLQQMDETHKEILYLQDQLDRKLYGEFENTYVDVYDFFRRATDARDAGNYPQALTLLETGFESAGSDMAWAFLEAMSTVYRAMREFEKAEEYAKRAAELNPKDANIMYGLAVMQKNNGHIDKAILTLQEAERLSQGELRLRVQIVLAGYLFHTGKRDQAMEKFNSLSGQLDNSVDAITYVAWFRAVAGPKDEFYKALDHALGADQDGSIFSWIDVEVDLDPYREEARFIELLNKYSYKR